MEALGGIKPTDLNGSGGVYSSADEARLSEGCTRTHRQGYRSHRAEVARLARKEFLMAAVDDETKLLQYAQSVAIRAELLEACRKGLDKVSSDAAREARKHVV